MRLNYRKDHNVLFQKVFQICAILFILTVCLWNVGMQERIRVVDDEFAYWGIAARLAGLDWSGAMSHTEYYSYGYSLLLVPLYWLLRAGVDVHFIYRAAIFMNAVFLCLSFYFASQTGRRLFPDVSPLFIQAAALLSVLYVGNVIQSGCAWTEVCLSFLFWCGFYCVVRLSEKPTIKWILLTLILGAYLFAVHMRTIAVALWMAVIVFLRLLSEKGKERKQKLLIAGALFLILLAGVWIMRNYVKENIYFMGDGRGQTNDFTGQIPKIQMLFSVSGMIDIIFSVCGKIFYVGVVSYCLGIFTVFISLKSSVVFCLKSLKNKKWNTDAAFFVKLFLLGASAGAVLVDALFKVIPYYYNGRTAALADAVIYGRYVDFIIGPLFFVGILSFCKLKEHYRELLLSVLTLIGCGCAAQKIWNILLFYNDTNLGLRGTAVPGLVYMFDGTVERLAFVLIAWAVAGLFLFLILFLPVAGRTKFWFPAFFCILLSVASAVVGNRGIVSGIEGKSNKVKAVDSAAGLLNGLEEDVGIYYLTRDGSVTGDMKILQWELPERTIQVEDIDIRDTATDLGSRNAVYLADSGDDCLNAFLNGSCVYLYDSGTLSVYAPREGEAAQALKPLALEARACGDPKPVGVDLSKAVAEWGYQKANGEVYLSDQRTEEYLTWQTGLRLDDGIYEIEIDLNLAYYEEGNIGYITLTDETGDYLDTRVLTPEDFGPSGRGKITVEMPVRDYREPIVGVYSSGNGAMKVRGITFRRRVGCIPVEAGREEEWEQIAKILEANAVKQMPVYYVDTDGSGKTGFPEFTEVNGILPEPIREFCTGQQFSYLKTEKKSCFIMEKAEDGKISLPETGYLAGESEHYYVVLMNPKEQILP